MWRISSVKKVARSSPIPALPPMRNDRLTEKLGPAVGGDRCRFRGHDFLSPRRTRLSGLAGDEVLSKGGAGVLLTHQAREEEHRTAWPVVHHEVLGLPGGVAANRDDHAGGLTLDLTGVVLDEAVVAVVADELELLVLIQLAGVEHECSDGLRALNGALHRRALPGDVVGQVVQPPRVIGASHI